MMNLVISKMMTIYKQGEIWLANLNPNKGKEPGKTRPVLILQHEALLKVAHPTTIILPLTTKLIEDAEPLRFRIPAQDQLEQDSDLLIDQIRAIDNRCLTNGPLMQCQPNVLKKILRLVSEVIGM